MNLAMTALHDDGRAGIHLCVLRLRGRWGVTGYLWDGKPVLGLEFPSSGE